MSRCFAVIPAAGASVRMGQPKLRMLFRGKPLIAHAIDAWRRSQVESIVVVIRPGDDELIKLVRAEGLEPVMPAVPPPDMKDSVLAALSFIQRCHKPEPADAFLVAPADMPGLLPAVIDRLIAEHCRGDKPAVLVPMSGTRRGHPTLFPWSWADEVRRLGPDHGLNAIVKRGMPRLVACEDLMSASESEFDDIDTPEDLLQHGGEA